MSEMELLAEGCAIWQAALPDVDLLGVEVVSIAAGLYHTCVILVRGGEVGGLAFTETLPRTGRGVRKC